MQFIDYNFVSDDVAKNIMESYGYEVPAKDEVVSEDVAAPELPDYVCVVNETTYALCEGVEEVDGQLFIPVMEVNSELHEALADNDTTLLESVEMDDASYEFGDIFEDEQTGEMFIAINEMSAERIGSVTGKALSTGEGVNQKKTPAQVQAQVNRINDLASGQDVSKGAHATSTQKNTQNKEMANRGYSPNENEGTKEAGRIKTPSVVDMADNRDTKDLPLSAAKTESDRATHNRNLQRAR